MEKVRKDREVAMRQKDALVKTLSEAANALESSLKVSCPLYFTIPHQCSG